MVEASGGSVSQSVGGPGTGCGESVNVGVAEGVDLELGWSLPWKG